MEDFQSALRARISSVIGHGRVYWGAVPQGTAGSYVRLTTVSDQRPLHLKGYTTSRETRVQMDVFAGTYAEARQMSETIIAAVERPEAVGAVQFGRTRAEGPRDLGEDVTGGTYIHRLSTDLLVWHSLA